jgi:hypothetical protein
MSICFVLSLLHIINMNHSYEIKLMKKTTSYYKERMATFRRKQQKKLSKAHSTASGIYRQVLASDNHPNADEISHPNSAQTPHDITGHSVSHALLLADLGMINPVNPGKKASALMQSWRSIIISDVNLRKK